ncbi:hypothetical protein C0991_004935 [Blastosporella zonata]|nr:hypothetical protein C0991_004935 [Blastosporella zonata]
MPDHDDLAKLKVTELKVILSKAEISSPARKNDIIVKILGEPKALAVYAQLYPSDADVQDAPPTTPPTTTTTIPPPEPVPVQPLVDEAEKRRLRAERFGIPVVEAPKPRPTAPQKRSPLDDPTKLATRAARFAANQSQKRPPAESVDPAEEERRRKRAERFGINPTAA